MDSLLRVTLLGSLTAAKLSLSDTPPITHFRTHKTAALLGYLAFHAGVPQPREGLIVRFWPDSELEQGRMSLRTALSALRKDLGVVLATDKMTVTLHTQTDLQDFEQAAHRAHLPSLPERERVSQLQRATHIYGGPLLPGLYDDWIFPERERLASLQQAALLALARWHEGLGELVQAISYTRQATIADPFAEELRAELIRLLKKNGQLAEARRQFEDLERLLLEHLGTRPGKEIGALVADVGASTHEEPVMGRRVVVLPLSRGRFRGRREELVTLVQRLSGGKRDADGARLFTLFGPGGIGKTRLAIEAGRRLAAHGVLGEVRFVALAEATTADQIWEAIATALEMRAASLPSVVEVAARLGHSGTSLLLLDNVEQVALEAGEIATSLLAAVPGLTVLATSRRRLGTPDEELIAVGALPSDEGVALFVDRARSVVPDYHPTEVERASLETLVRRLEGFPLAIELAAAWASALTPAEMLTQLEAGLLALPERSDGPERHSSLTAAIQWSVNLLGPELRRGFLALSLFRGGWFAPAAESVCGVGREALASLRDRSLLTAQAQGDQLRFGMPMALRAFGEALLTAQEKADLMARHSAYFLTVAEHEKHPLHLTWEHANFQRALTTQDAPQHVRLCLALAPFWDQQGHWREGQRELTRALEHTTVAEERAQLLYSLGRLTFHLCDYERSTEAHQAALVIWEAQGNAVGIGRGYQALAAIGFHHSPNLDQVQMWTERSLTHFERAEFAPGQAAALIGLGAVATARGDRQAARVFQERSLAVATKASELHDQAVAHHRLGSTLVHLGELARAQAHLEAAEQLFQTLQNTNGLAYVLVDQGVVAYHQGVKEDAGRNYERALVSFRETEDLWGESVCQGNLARLATEQGNYSRAAQVWGESLKIRILLGDSIRVLIALDSIAHLLACLARDTADPEAADAALCLQAASVALRKQLGIAPPEPEENAPAPELLEELVGILAAQGATQRGGTLTLEQAMSLAQEMLFQVSNLVANQ